MYMDQVYVPAGMHTSHSNLPTVINPHACVGGLLVGLRVCLSINKFSRKPLLKKRQIADFCKL